MSWQTIDSAPKDGTEVLLAWAWEDFNIDTNEMQSGWRIVSGQFGTPTVFGQTGSWWADNGAAGVRLPDQPTHWMPLPAPPGADPGIPVYRHPDATDDVLGKGDE